MRQYALGGEGNKPTGGWLSQLGYLYPPEAEDTIAAITHWVCVDLNTKVCTTLFPHQTCFFSTYNTRRKSCITDCHAYGHVQYASASKLFIPLGAYVTDMIWAWQYWTTVKFELVQAGQGLLLAALDHLQEAPAAEGAAARVGVLYNPADTAAEPSLLARLLLATTQLTSRRPKIAGEHLLSLSILCWCDMSSSQQIFCVSNCIWERCNVACAECASML